MKIKQVKSKSLFIDYKILSLGDFGCVTWEGYDFTTDLTINTEICRWIWYNKIHDGPVTHAVRNRQDANWIATIGGKIYAVWKENFGLPVMWKKLDIGYFTDIFNI